MRTVTVNFTGGKPFSLEMPDDAARALIKALAANSNGTTEITDNDGLFCVINRAQITYVDLR